MPFVLVHSPLVGPTTWRWVAEALVDAGHDVVVPDLRDAAVVGDPEAMISAVIASVPPTRSRLVIVGHSGAGSLLPFIAGHFDGRLTTRIVFVDAGIPPCAGRATPSADFLDQLRNLAVDGVLPKWSTWWGEGAMDSLVPDRRRRVELETEMVEVPLEYFESSFEVPDRWCETHGSFLLLSEPYRDDAERARFLGWRTAEQMDGHLAIVNDAAGVAGVILDLTR